MKCMSCEANVDPKWKHAVKSNVCPYCGLVIMDEELKKLLLSLEKTMSKLAENPEQLDYWMKANYGFVRGGKKSGIAKEKFDVDDEDLSEETLASLEAVEGFAARSGHSLEKQRKIKEIAMKVKKEGGEMIIQNEDEQFFEGTGQSSDMIGALASSIAGQSDFQEEPIHPAALALAQGASSSNAADLAKLQNLYGKSKTKSNEMAMSGSVGVIKRG